jgi:hypothetical protein
MRESRKYGSVRGALSNGRPYRDRGAKLVRSSCKVRKIPLLPRTALPHRLRATGMDT